MIDPNAARRLSGDTVVDADGREIGQVVEVYIDDRSDVPTWAAVDTGLVGAGRVVVPLTQAEFMGNRLRLPYDKGTIASAPAVQPDHGRLSSADAAELSTYYGSTIEQAGQRARADAVRGSEVVTQVELTRSAEQLRVATEWFETERIRLRKVIVTENVTVTVPITREELHVEREVISGRDNGGAVDAPAAPRAHHEIVLHAERPVVTTEVVPVERVRVSTVTVTGQDTVTDSLREERIEVESDLNSPPGDR